MCIIDISHDKILSHVCCCHCSFKAPGARSQADVLLFGKKLVAKDALDLGLVQKITTSKDLLNDAITLVRTAYKGTPGLQRAMLQTMKEDTFVEILNLFDDNVHDLASKL
jgi:enoyl-CoA hydratase/carnithine racemase